MTMAATRTVAKDTGKSLARTLGAGRMVTLARVPDGYVGKALGDLARTVKGRTVFVARDGQRLAEIERALAFFAPEVELSAVPGLGLSSLRPRLAASHRRRPADGDALAAPRQPTDRPAVVLTTVNAVLQRAPPRAFVEKGSFSAAARQPGPHGRPRPLARGQRLRADDHRARGRRIRRARRHPRPFPGGAGERPSGSTSSATRSNRSAASMPTASAPSRRGSASISCPPTRWCSRRRRSRGFGRAMSTLFGTADRDDLLYQSISEGRRYVGMEHWLPLFSEGLETLFDYTSGSPVILDHLVEEAVGERLDLIEDHYRGAALGSRRRAGRRSLQATPAGPRSTSTRAEWADRLGERPRAAISPFAQPDRPEVIDMGGARRAELRR